MPDFNDLRRVIILSLRRPQTYPTASDLHFKLVRLNGYHFEHSYLIPAKLLRKFHTGLILGLGLLEVGNLLLVMVDSSPLSIDLNC